MRQASAFLTALGLAAFVAPAQAAGLTVRTLAGLSPAGFSDGTGVNARFNGLSSIAVDSAGNAFVADPFNCAIRKVTPAGVVTTFAGSDHCGSTTEQARPRDSACRMGLPSTARTRCTWPVPLTTPFAKSRRPPSSRHWQAWQATLGAPTGRAAPRGSTFLGELPRTAPALSTSPTPRITPFAK